MDNFREWLSDNLRYILLILGILGILLVLFFGVRALSGRFGAVGGSDFSSDSVVPTTVNDDAESVESEAETVLGGELQEDAAAEVTALINEYYTALNNKDAAAAAALCDTLPEDEAAQITSSTTQYSEIKVYTKEGPETDSYVVYAYYQYLDENQTTALPGLSQMFVKKDDSGSYKIIYSDLDQETSDYISALAETEDVKALIAQVQEEFNTASAASQTAAAETPTPEVTETPVPTETPTPEVTETPVPTEAPTPEVTEAPAPTEAPQTPTVRAAAIKSDCNVRSGPGYEYGKIAELRTGNMVEVIGEMDGGWWHIRTPQFEGYVGKWFID